MATPQAQTVSIMGSEDRRSMQSPQTAGPSEDQGQTTVPSTSKLPFPQRQLRDLSPRDSGWNILPPPNEIMIHGVRFVPSRPQDHLHWMIQEENGSRWNASGETRWSELSEAVELGSGFWVYQTRQPMVMLYLGISGSEMTYQLGSPGPSHYFSFDRYAQRLTDQETCGEEVEGYRDPDRVWLYSVYGYVLSDQIVCLRYRPTREMEFLVLPRPVVFPW